MYFYFIYFCVGFLDANSSVQ